MLEIEIEIETPIVIQISISISIQPSKDAVRCCLPSVCHTGTGMASLGR